MPQSRSSHSLPAERVGVLGKVGIERHERVRGGTAVLAAMPERDIND